MYRFASAGLSLLPLALLAPAALAQQEAYRFDPSHTDITFRVSHLGLSDTHGRFNNFTGEVMLDEADPENSSVDVTIYTWSVDTAWDPRDDHLRRADFFDVATHPAMRFVSTDVETTGEDTAQVTGDLTLLGQTHPVTLDVTLNQIGDHPRTGQRMAGFTATGMIDRTQWGMDWGAGNIGTEVHIRIDAEVGRVPSE